MKETNESVLIESPKKFKTSHLLRMRARGDDQDPNYKSAILILSKLIPDMIDEVVLARKLTTKLQDIPGNRDVVKAGPLANTPEKRPLTVFTPKGSELTREKDYGFMLLYSNKNLSEQKRNLPNLSNIELKDILKEPPKDFTKFQEIVVTKDLVEKALEHSLKRGTKGIPDQNTVMSIDGDKQKASATKIAKLLDLQTQPDELFEWLHLIMFLLKKKAAQDPANLTGGTKHANTDMMMGEDILVYLSFLLDEDIKLHVTSVEQGFHFAKEIRFTIETKHFTLPFIFNAQTSVQPSRRNTAYLHAIVETIVEELVSLFAKPPSAKKTLKFCDKENNVATKMPPLLTAKTKPPVLFWGKRSKEQSSEKSEKKPKLEPKLL